MSENSLRITPERENASRLPNGGSRAGGATVAAGVSIFAGFEKKLKLESYFVEGFPVKYLPRVLFVVFLCVVYIGNTHYGERTTREINKAQSEVEDLRADYTTLKADVMFSSKQSEVARRTRQMGLRESLKPPFKIVVEKGEY